MGTLFAATDRAAIEDRLGRLGADAKRAWGTMDPAQMLTHCALPLETALGDRPVRQKLVGKLVGPFVRGLVLGERPFMRNAPTDPMFVVADPREFEAERSRLSALIARFADAGPDAAAAQTHIFFGRLSGDQWGRLMYKHLDHHLRQFGA